MHLSKHKPHRNIKYLAWLRTKNCIVSGKKAECAHHIRLSTNGGTSLKPSDYFCIPLLNEFHTTGQNALHIVGEETFLNQFSLDPKNIFVTLLKDYLFEVYEIPYKIESSSEEEIIKDLIELIESKIVRSSRVLKKKSKVKKQPTPKVSITENSYYQEAKKLKNERDKELRKKLKEESKSTPTVKKQFKGNEFYEKAKEAKRLRDKELRQKLKATKK